MKKVNNIESNYEYLYENPNIDTLLKNKIIEKVCKEGNSKQITMYLVNNVSLNLSIYNISDLVKGLCIKGTYEDVIEVSKLKNLSKHDRLELTEYVCKFNDTSILFGYIEASEYLYEENYHQICETVKKSKNAVVIGNFIISYGDKLYMEDLTNLIYILFSKCINGKDVIVIDIMIKISHLPFIGSNIDTIVNNMCLFADSLELYRFAKNNNNLERGHIKRIIRELGEEENLDINIIKDFAMNINNLDKNDISNLTVSAIKTGNIKGIINFAIEVQNLSKEDLDKLTSYVSLNGTYEDKFKFAKNVKNLSDDNIRSIANSLILISHMYHFLVNVDNIPNDTKKELKEKILLSKNMKYICLLAALVDISLLFELFKNVNEYIAYINNIDYSDGERLSIYNRLLNMGSISKKSANEVKEKLYVLTNNIENKR